MSTVSDLLTRLRFLLEEEQPSYFDDDRLTECLDEGQSALVLYLHPAMLMGTDFQATVTRYHASGSTYDLPSDLVKIYRVTRDQSETEGGDSEIPVHLMDENTWGAQKKHAAWAGTPNSPVGYIWGSELTVLPAAGNTSSTRGVKIWYIKEPTTLTSSSSVEITVAMEHILLRWAAHRAAERDGLTEQSALHLKVAMEHIERLNAMAREHYPV